MRPDIILSVGTGVQVQRTGKARSEATRRSCIVQKMIPKGIKTKVATTYDMIHATLDCEREWRDFVQSKSHDPQFVRNCHRLDVALAEKVPKIDEIDMIQELGYRATSYLSQGYQNPQYLDSKYKSAHHHIQVVARRLVAALFYFEPDYHSSRDGMNRGTIRCRLSPTMRSQFASLIASEPAFRLREWSGKGNDASWDIFHLDPFNVQTFSSNVKFYSSSADHQGSIEVCFKRKSIEWEPISGF